MSDIRLKNKFEIEDDNKINEEDAFGAPFLKLFKNMSA